MSRVPAEVRSRQHIWARINMSDMTRPYLAKAAAGWVVLLPLLVGCGTRTASPALTIVPGVVGLQQGRATEEIVSWDGLRLRVVREASNVAPAGAVLSENPAANSAVDPGSYVTIVVSTGRPASGQEQVAASPAAHVVIEYLDAVQAGDCARAERFTRPLLFGRDGDLCDGTAPGPIRFDRWRGQPNLPPAHPAVGDYEYGVELHVTSLGPAAGGIGTTGWHEWFLEAKDGRGGYELVAGGSGP
jgi:hypothetical protein